MKTALTLAAALAGLVVAAPNALGGDQPQGFTFITDTLGGNGGTPVVVAASTPAAGFSWPGAAVGAATAAGSILVLVSGTLIALPGRGRLVL